MTSVPGFTTDGMIHEVDSALATGGTQGVWPRAAARRQPGWLR
jgi:hypothetical protein